MKVIGSMQGLAASRQVVEEYVPENGVTPADIIELVKSAYFFETYPIIAPGHLVVPSFIFANGKYLKEDTGFAISHLIMETNGDVVQATNTDQADAVLDDLAMRLDKSLGFRLTVAKSRRSYISNLVVEFDRDFVKNLGMVEKIAELVNSAKESSSHFSFKRLAFGEPAITAPVDQISTVETSDFIIERRAGSTIEDNRFFCSAPMKTTEHITLLQRIEETIRQLF